MTRPNRPALSRRTLLGGTAVAGVGAVLASGTAAAADSERRRNPIDQAAVDAVAARLDGDLIALRRDLHQHPETTGKETYTAAAVAARLRAAGLDVTTGVGRTVKDGKEVPGTGVVAVLRGARPGRTVAYRADMDAVPGDGIVPRVPGPSAPNQPPAHACGHDLHTTVGVGVAQTLAQLRHRLSGTVVFFFQPGEEGLVGARAMIDDGVLETTGAEEIHALHCGPYPVGRFAVTPGSGLPGQDWAAVTLAGPDATAAAGRLKAEIGRLGTVAMPQGPADLEKMVADVQTPDGPLARFVVTGGKVNDPDAEGRVRLDVKFRCWPQERNVEIRERIRQLAQSYAGAVVTYPRDPFPALVCPEDDANALARHLRRVLGTGGVTVNHAAFPFNGEDYALFMERIPGTYTFLGVRTPGSGIETSYPHYETFTPDERAIGVGVRAMAGWLATRTRR
ncbi:amidohydrolase [Streptomyces sp. CB01881]|uniref:M20 metallopeptidase family protein n=1 Tax=Streptomyces sp. CB01881 TaxID=2078691 RepID=UPI000CDCA3C0|nr:amidohydrolase [Streptomyces sp. CB01881]AUY49995.1 amidohydrolase [Streptomyces sp. CB01881]TYC73392.1 amidohydrolase [Streptomyces sp. CB01881]